MWYFEYLDYKKIALNSFVTSVEATGSPKHFNQEGKKKTSLCYIMINFNNNS